MTVQQLRTRGDLRELNAATDVDPVKQSLHLACELCVSMFIRKSDGVFMEIWGTGSENPEYTDEVHQHQTSA
jgi:hypothetical protein